jgi:hypothetical protein
LPVIPAKAGIQPLLLAPEKLDPSFRWDDEPKDDEPKDDERKDEQRLEPTTPRISIDIFIMTNPPKSYGRPNPSRRS